MTVGDFDLDGKHEIVFSCAGNKVRALRHRGGAYETYWDSPSHSQNVKNVAIYDIDGDGHKELIVLCLSNMYIYNCKAGKIILEWTRRFLMELLFNCW